MTFRRLLFWTHLVVGALAGLVVLLMSVTGVILAFEVQLNEWALRDYRAAAAPAAPLPADRLLEIAAAAAPEGAPPSSLRISADPLDPAVAGLGRGRSLYLDRGSGAVLGDGNGRMRRFLRSVRYWHRWLALENESRAAGRAVTGAANLLFLFLILSGIVLWWPRNRPPRALRNALWFRRGLRGRARNFNWHNVAGFWLALPLAVVVVSGAMISYRWVGRLIEFAAAGPPTAAAQESLGGDESGDPLPPPATPPATPTTPPTLQGLLDRAAAETPGWRRLTLRLPADEADPRTVRTDTGAGRQPSKWRRFRFDRATGALLGVGPVTETRAQAVRYWLRFAHTGEVYGIPGQIVAAVASAAGALLVWTGFAMAWRRFFPKKNPPKKNPPKDPSRRTTSREKSRRNEPFGPDDAFEV